MVEHEVEWTPEKLARFWDFTARTMPTLYFARQVGHSVISYVSRHIPIRTALDLGCGEGDLIAHLLANPVYGADQSPVSVAAVNRRFSGEPNFRGATVGTEGLPEVDTIFMIEVVEHMDDAALKAAISEARRLLKHSGNLVITTPNEEVLALGKRMCPDCGCIFHQMQHVRSWSAASLSAFMSAQGFKTVRCEPTLFSLYKGIKAAVDRMRYRKRSLPNLVYIGTPA
jgi:SAM-dependent methyltransferase